MNRIHQHIAPFYSQRFGLRAPQVPVKLTPDIQEPRRWGFKIGLAIGAIIGLLCGICRGDDKPMYRTPYEDPRVRDCGKDAFWDTRCSIISGIDPQTGKREDTSCEKCHNPDIGWGDDKDRSIGIRGLVGNRVSLPTFNLEDPDANSPSGFKLRDMFWDSRAKGILRQPRFPLTNRVEHGNQSEQQVADRLDAIDGYHREFGLAFGEDMTKNAGAKRTKTVTVDRLNVSLAAYMLQFQSYDAPVDKFVAGDESAFTAKEHRGFTRFMTPLDQVGQSWDDHANPIEVDGLGCASCHSGPNRRDGTVHNTGVSEAFAGKDIGVGDIIKEKDGQGRLVYQGFFQTPMIRNMQERSFLFHDGSAKNIHEAFAHYNRGGADLRDRVDRRCDPRVTALKGRITPEVEDDLTAFVVDGCEGTMPTDTPPASFPQ